MPERAHPGEERDGKLRERAQEPGREEQGESGEREELRDEGERLLLHRSDRLDEAHHEADDQRETEERRDDVEREDDGGFEEIDGEVGIHGGLGGEALDEGADDEVPAIHEDEEEELERQLKENLGLSENVIEKSKKDKF